MLDQDHGIRCRSGLGRGLAAVCLGLCLSACALLGDGTDGGPARPIFYPDLPLQPRVQHLATYSTRNDVTGGLNLFQRLIVGRTKDSELGKPYGLAMHGEKIFVCDSRLGSVVVFDLGGRRVDMFGHKPPGRLQKPMNLAIDEDGTRFIADLKLRRVMVYDDHDRYVTAFGDPMEWAPGDVAIHGDALYVTDVQNGRILVLDKKTGAKKRQIGRKGSDEGELFFPTNLDVDRDGKVYVTDTGNFRVLRFDSRGRFERQFGSLGKSTGHFARPKGLAVDREGRLYVSDSAFENVQVFDSGGQLLMAFGSAGNMPGGMNLPAQVEIDYEHVDLFADRVAPGYAVEYLILVSSQYGSNKVNVYGFLREGEPAKGERAAAHRAGDE